ncbi:MAG: energy transducer TonB [Sphingobium sp.]|nr:energy transducer TonB [Sphingobium sp.]
MFKTVAKSFLLGASLVIVTTPAFAGDWAGSVARLVASKQTYPTAAQMRGDEGTAKVRVSVGADGTVSATELVAGSGSALLDKEALALPKKIGKFPAPDAGQSSIVLPLTWKLQ